MKLSSILLENNKTIRDAMIKMNDNALDTLMIVDEQEILIGVITDGDIRRRLLKNNNLDEKVIYAMNRDFVSASVKDKREDVLELRKDGIKLGDVHPSPYITSDWTPEQEDQWYENNQAVYMSAEDEKIITDFKEKEENESEKAKETNNEDS